MLLKALNKFESSEGDLTFQELNLLLDYYEVLVFTAESKASKLDAHQNGLIISNLIKHKTKAVCY